MEEELNRFVEFKKNYLFEPKTIEEVDGKEYCEGFPLIDDEGNKVGECEKWINVGYKNKGHYAKALSNLFPYEFIFRGKHLKSIESFFQGIKFKDINMQNLVFNYSALESNYIKVCNDHDWKEDGLLYWQGESINRFGKEYDDLVNELYISAIQNPLYRTLLKNVEKDIIHTLGALNKEETVFTRYEFEYQLNCLKEFVKIYKK